jgi:tRNA1(Val) A37 N6-methylase TrmN6
MDAQGKGREKENPGFDAVIGNPPYDVLDSEELGYDVSQELKFYENTALFEPAIRGKKNLYKTSIDRIF